MNATKMNATKMRFSTVLGVDPGKQKTGLAIVDGSGAIIWRDIAPTASLREALLQVFRERPVARVALGHSTGSEAAAALIREVLAEVGSPAELEVVNERNSTLEARSLFYEAYPPRGLMRLVPLSLQSPSIPIDDFAAAILARRAQAAVSG